MPVYPPSPYGVEGMVAGAYEHVPDRFDGDLELRGLPWAAPRAWLDRSSLVCYGVARSGIPEAAMKTMTLKVAETVVARLDRLADKRRTTRSQVIRDALAQYLDSDHSGPVSFADLAREDAGCFEGPGDLSTNPKYMEDFGR